MPTRKKIKPDERTQPARARSFGRVDDDTWRLILECVPEGMSQVEFFTEAVFAYAASSATKKEHAEWKRRGARALAQASDTIERARRAFES